VRDGASEWTLASRALDIDVNPLSIAGAGGERIDAILVNRDPF
jgi:hypothetical protein